jgi:hypothetical protein
MAGLKVDILEMKGKAVHLHREPIIKIGKISIPENVKMSQRVRLKVLGIGPDVHNCEIGDYVIVAPTAQFIQPNPVDGDEILIDDCKHILAKVSYEESLIEVATAAAVPQPGGPN